MLKGYQELKEQTARKSLLYRPVFFRITDPTEKEALSDLLQQGNIFLYDEIKDQLRELIKSRNPTRKLQDHEYAELIAQHLNGCDIQDYGVWVYYPWSERVVHILDEQEYIELRTSANKNKISIAERDKLATKKVGVIGLSVGQSVSVTMAMERICGELRLADFDNLELNNLNRIRTGVHNLGLLKVHSVAREIAEIDPYLKTVCFPEGITDENINAFYTDGGKLDVVIDECDGVNVKILCRIKAKELGIPVLMEASDKGTLDVERFDLEPSRPIMHGWLEHLSLDLEVLKNLKTNEEKLPYMLPIAGFETLSNRMKASLLEMGISLTTWPQLATAVTLGGAITADTCRRMLLDQYTDSGRYFIDMEQLVPDKRPKVPYQPEVTGTPLMHEDMAASAKAALAHLDMPETQLNQEEIMNLVTTAVAAPSTGNTQPWQWYYSGGMLFLYRDNAHEALFSNINGIAPHLDLGAALENLALAAHGAGYHIVTHLFPLAGNHLLVAAIAFTKDQGAVALHQPETLRPYTSPTQQPQTDAAPDTEDIMIALKTAANSIPGVNVLLSSAEEVIRKTGELISASERLKFFIPASHYEFFNRHLKWPGPQKHEDGIGIETMGLQPAEMMSLRVVMNPDIASLLSEWRGGKALELSARKSFGSPAAIGIVSISGAAPQQLLEAGRAIQRMCLTAASMNCRIVPAQGILLQFAHLKNDGRTSMPAHVRIEVAHLKEEFDSLFGENISGEGIFFFSLVTNTTGAGSRHSKPLEKVLSFGK